MSGLTSPAFDFTSQYSAYCQNQAQQRINDTYLRRALAGQSNSQYDMQQCRNNQFVSSFYGTSEDDYRDTAATNSCPRLGRDSESLLQSALVAEVPQSEYYSSATTYLNSAQAARYRDLLQSPAAVQPYSEQMFQDDSLLLNALTGYSAYFQNWPNSS